MRQIQGHGVWAAIVLAAIGLSAGCTSSLNGVDRDEAQYILWVTLERNLDLNTDVLVVQYLTADSNLTGGQVIVEGQVVSNFDAEGKVTITRQPSQPPYWDPGDMIHIVALDSTETVVHSDSVVMPGLFHIINVDPFNEPWRFGQPNPRFDWEISNPAEGYVISVKARNHPEARGYAAYYEAQIGPTATLTSDVFRDVYDAPVFDYYDINIIAYNPNFVPRNNPPYKLPEFPPDDKPSPIVNDNVDGYISALLVSDRATIEVAQ